jgi:hypothetical protein
MSVTTAVLGAKMDMGALLQRDAVQSILSFVPLSYQDEQRRRAADDSRFPEAQTCVCETALAFLADWTHPSSNRVV